MANVVIVGGSPLSRECLRLALESGADHRAATFAFDDTSWTDDPAPDVLIVDASATPIAPGDVRPLIERSGNAAARVLLVASLDEELDLLGFEELEIRGYVFGVSTVDELYAAIDALMRGEPYCSPSGAAILFESLTMASTRRSRTRSMILTRREREVLDLVRQDQTNAEIAEELCISVYTVKNHVHSILKKLRADDRREAVRVYDRFEAELPGARVRRED